MHIVLLGKNGQVGWELQRALAPLGHVTALDHHTVWHCGDLSKPAELALTLRELKPDVIVNAAAYTAVDKAEREPELAYQINAASVAVLAKEAEALGAWLVHYSTDYVFNGKGTRPWQETDTPNPLNIYGKTKLAGEQAITLYCSRHLIFRTSWVYSVRGNNFAGTMLRLARERQELAVVSDQIGAPTGAELIADCSAQALRMALAKPELAGLYHLTATGETSWHHYAAFVFDHVRSLGEPLKLEQLKAMSSHDWPASAQRPTNSRLNTQSFTTAFQLTLPPWQVGVTRMLNELLDKKS